jgi:hypothetical protein
MPNPTDDVKKTTTTTTTKKTPTVEKVKPVKISHNEWIDTYGETWTPETAVRDVYGHPFKGQGYFDVNRRAKQAAGVSQVPPVPTVPSTTTVNLGLRSGGLTDVPSPETNPAAGVPRWWNSTIYTNPNAEQQFANAANALLPYLSPEDQRNIANYLSSNFKDVYGSYANAALPAIPTNVSGLREQYLNPTRVQDALGLLDKVQQASGGTPGAGYGFLKNALNLMNKYTTAGSPMTREQYNQFVNGVKEMTTSVGKDLSAYSNLSQLFNLPNFTAGNLVSNVPIARLNV